MFYNIVLAFTTIFRRKGTTFFLNMQINLQIFYFLLAAMKSWSELKMFCQMI